MAYEEIEVAGGTFIGWGTRKGQHVTGKVLDYDETGGNDFGNNPCPLLEIELTERAASFTKDGERTDYDPGEIIMVTCGQANLKRKVKRAELKKGDKVKITLADFVRVNNGTMKEFSVQVERASGSSGGGHADLDDSDDEIPF